MLSLRPILLVAVVSLCSAARGVADDDTLPPPATVTPFPFCPPLPPGGSIGPFPWTTPPPGSSTGQFPWAPPPPRTLYPQDPGYFPSVACHARMAVAWLPMAFVLSALLVLLQ